MLRAITIHMRIFLIFNTKRYSNIKQQYQNEIYFEL